MRTNPVTLTPLADPKLTEKVDSQQAARRVVDDVAGFVALDKRTRGSTKLFFYHVFNFATLGLLGGVAANVANSAVMGSQKDNAWVRAWKDLGQTHLNATQGRTLDRSKRPWHEKTINFLSRSWTNTIGTVASLGTMAIARTITHGFQRRDKTDAFRRQFQYQHNRPPSRRMLRQLDTGTLMDIAAHGDAKARKIAVAETKAQLRDANKSLSASQILRGSPERKQLFAKHLEKEYSAECMFFTDWAERATAQVDGGDILDGKLTADDASYRLGKFDIANAHNQLVKTGSEYEVNIAHRDRNEWNNFVNDASNGLQDFRRRWNRSVNRYRDLTRRLGQPNLSKPQRNRIKAQLHQVRMEMDRMKQETLSPEASKQIGTVIDQTYGEMISLMNDAAIRFTPELMNPLQ
jgi:hypothetical protein